jgi:hypothetical protein
MTTPAIFIIGAALCAISAAASRVLITVNLDRRGIKTSWPLMRWYFFRNLNLYREETVKSSGKVGPLFYSFIVSINAVWVLLLLSVFTR